MTTLAVIGDIHDHQPRLEAVLADLAPRPLDGVLLVGDVSWNPPWSERMAHLERQRESFAAIVAQIRDRLGVPLLYVPGNHDPRDVTAPGNVDGALAEIGGVRVVGVGGGGPAFFGFPYERTEAQVRALVLPEADLILAHPPPRDTPIDALHRGRGHVGSAAVRERAASHRGVLVCGHIHESAGFVQLGACLCANVGALGEPFGAACHGLVELDRTATEDRWTVTLTRLEPHAVQRRVHHVPRLP